MAPLPERVLLGLMPMMRGVFHPLKDMPQFLGRLSSHTSFDSNEDKFFTPSDDVELLLHHDPSISVTSILEGFIDESPLEENDDLFDLESKENDWKKILHDASIDDLMTEDKVFDPEIHEKKIPSGESKGRLSSHTSFDSNEDKFFTPSDDVELLLHHDPFIRVAFILEGFIDEQPLEENDDLFDLEPKEND
ncbi:hypothetical protein Tco_1336586 [Tanacetum coccineum]